MKITGKQILIVVLPLSILLVVGFTTFADTMSSTNYAIDRTVVAGGGGEAASTGYISPGSATGQSSALGNSSSTGYSLVGGYFGAGVNSAPVATAASINVPINTAYNGTLTATDVDSDPLTYAIVTNGTKGSAVVTNAATGAFTYTPTTGQSGADSFTFKANDGEEDSIPATITVTLVSGDTTAPTGSIAINAGAVYTRSASVTLNLTASDPSTPIQMFTGNSSTPPIASDWKAYATPVNNWALTAGDGTKTVYAWLKDSVGNYSSVPYSDSIILDTAIPVLNVTKPTDGAIVSNPSLSVTCTASDATSGVGNVTVNGTVATLTSGIYSGSVTLATGSNNITVIATDNAGNPASVIRTVYLVKAGDCDNSGSISIAEVQAAINMYLGLMLPVQACVDTDNSGTVSIAEVQKVINGYLGL